MQPGTGLVVSISTLMPNMRIRRVTYIAELLVHLEDLVGNLGASDHGPLAHLLEDRAGEEHQLLVLALVLVVALLLFLHLLGNTPCVLSPTSKQLWVSTVKL